jgi:hypothetical protein
MRVKAWVPVVIAVTMLSACTGSGNSRAGSATEDDPSAASPSSTSFPSRSRLVGVGHVAVAVPAQWATNRVRCGTPRQDTVVIDQSVVEMCLMPRPAGVDSVTLSKGKPYDFHPEQSLEISGVAADVEVTACSTQEFGSGVVCSATVYVPSEGVSIHVASSTNKQIVDGLLDRIYVLPELVAVPGHLTVNTAAQDRAGERYLRLIHESGLLPRVRYVRDSDWPSGFVAAVSPDPGTMLEAGATVTVELSR